MGGWVCARVLVSRAGVCVSYDRQLQLICAFTRCLFVLHQPTPRLPAGLRSYPPSLPPSLLRARAHTHTHTRQVRAFAIRVVCHPVFEQAVLFIILYNTVILGATDYRYMYTEVGGWVV